MFYDDVTIIIFAIICGATTAIIAILKGGECDHLVTRRATIRAIGYRLDSFPGRAEMPQLQEPDPQRCEGVPALSGATGRR